MMPVAQGAFVAFYFFLTRNEKGLKKNQKFFCFFFCFFGFCEKGKKDFLGVEKRGGTTTPPMCSLFTVHAKKLFFSAYIKQIALFDKKEKYIFSYEYVRKVKFA